MTAGGSSSNHKDVEAAWAAGRADLTATTKNGAGSAAAALTGIYELEMRWPDQPGSCDTTGGNGGWLISPRGKLNQDHPLFPRSPDALTE